MTTRRSQLAALGLMTAAVPLAAAGTASPASAATALQIKATRKQITLPATPALGVPYIATFDLTDSTGKSAGTAWSSSSVVDLNLTGGPTVFGYVVLRLADGEIHYCRVLDRFGAYPYKSTGAVLGGTGTYKAATGTVDVVWPDANTINLTVNLG